MKRVRTSIRYESHQALAYRGTRFKDEATRAVFLRSVQEHGTPVPGSFVDILWLCIVLLQQLTAQRQSTPPDCVV